MGEEDWSLGHRLRATLPRGPKYSSYKSGEAALYTALSVCLVVGLVVLWAAPTPRFGGPPDKVSYSIPVLYNGIDAKFASPKRGPELFEKKGGYVWPSSAEKIHPEPPYLQSPPHTVNVTVGRQLFVDWFVVESVVSFGGRSGPSAPPSNDVMLTFFKPAMEETSIKLKGVLERCRGACVCEQDSAMESLGHWHWYVECVALRPA
jgi:hypothetical protein